MLRGVDILANAVKVTLGPKGRNVVIEKSFGAPRITKDGVTVAKEIELEDKFENMGAQMVKEVASKTSHVAGDGTTTATVLAQAIFTEGLKMVVAGHDPMTLVAQGAAQIGGLGATRRQDRGVELVVGTPDEWPLRFTLAHWAALLPGMAPGTYDLCCRTIDRNGIAQPLPRPLLRTGANGIHRVTMVVKG